MLRILFLVTLLAPLLSFGVAKKTITGNVTITGTLSANGTSTNDSASAGQIGQYLESVVSTFTDWPATTAAYGDGTSLSITAGDWDATAVCEFRDNGATIAGISEMGIGTASGSASTGLVGGSNSVGIGVPTGTSWWGGAVPAYRISQSGTATYYLKLFLTYSAGTPQYRCRLSARRVR